tara:strand:+ start:1070 stop:1642 length:573 start_codon:yes stop_codon:yes gene_type:complete
MEFRKAGQIMGLSTLGGAAGALTADRLSHDPMDRVAQDYKDFVGVYSSAPPEVQQAYAQVFGAGEISGMDRLIAAGILGGTIPGSQGEGPPQADSPAGRKAIEMAEQIRQQAPQLGQALSVLADKEMVLFAKEAQMSVGGQDVGSAEVVAAADSGAGVTPIPAVLGGLGAGGATAGAMALLDRFTKRRAA